MPRQPWVSHGLCTAHSLPSPACKPVRSGHLLQLAAGGPRPRPPARARPPGGAECGAPQVGLWLGTSHHSTVSVLLRYVISSLLAGSCADLLFTPVSVQGRDHRGVQAHCPALRQAEEGGRQVGKRGLSLAFSACSLASSLAAVFQEVVQLRSPGPVHGPSLPPGWRMRGRQ